MLQSSGECLFLRLRVYCMVALCSRTRKARALEASTFLSPPSSYSSESEPESHIVLLTEAMSSARNSLQPSAAWTT